jgi:hypothetical protein
MSKIEEDVVQPLVMRNWMKRTMISTLMIRQEKALVVVKVKKLILQLVFRSRDDILFHAIESSRSQ